MLVGFKALESRHQVRLVQPLRVESTIGTVRATKESQDRIEKQYPASYSEVPVVFRLPTGRSYAAFGC